MRACKSIKLNPFINVLQNPNNVVYVMDASIGQACEAQVKYAYKYYLKKCVC